MKYIIQGFLAGLLLLILVPLVIIGFFFQQIKTGFILGAELADEVNDFITQ